MIRILYFGIARERAGRASDEVPGEVASVDDLWRRLVDMRPELEDLRPVCRVAVDLSYANPDSPVPDGSEVAIIPPVAGG